MDAGLITGGYDDDKDKKQQQMKEGYKPYSIHIGNKYYTYDWAEPASSSLVMASEIYKAVHDDNEKTNLANAGVKAIQTGVDTWVNSSPLSSFAELMGSGQYASSFGERALETATNFPGSFVPAVVGATAKTMDTTQRNTYDPNSIVKSSINQTIAKIPQLSKTLPAKYDTWGNEIKRYNSAGEAAFANYVNPGVYSSEKHTPIDDAIEKLYKETGDNGVYPPTAEYKIDMGDDKPKRNLTTKEQSEYQKTMGQMNYKFAKGFLGSNEAKRFDSMEQADVLRKMYSFSRTLSQNTLFSKEIKDDSMKKMLEVYEQAGKGDKGINEVIKYCSDVAFLKKNGLSNTPKNMELLHTEGEKAVIDKGRATEALSKYEDLPNTEKNRELYLKGGDKALKEQLAYLQSVEAAGLNKKDTSDDGEEKEDKKHVIYTEKGDLGLKRYADTKQAVDTRNKDTTSKAEAALSYLNKQSMSDEEKGYYIAACMGKAGKTAQAYIDKGDYAGLYDYESHKYAADADGNNSLTNKEVETYLNKQNMTNQQRLVWFDKLRPSAKKNPYK
jgi:hypothetical protein